MDPSFVSRLRRGLRAGLATAAGALLCLAALQAPALAASSSDSLTFTIKPKDIYPPAPVVNLQAAAGGEGQLLLSWYAPDSNNNVFAASSPAAGYSIRIATYSVTSIGGSTVTWWNNAMDVNALPAPAVSVSPPTPAFPGTTQYLLLNQLWPGVTYYAMMISSDSFGNVSGADLNSIPPAVQASTLVFDAAPPAPTGLVVSQPGPGKIAVSWNPVNVFDMDFYRVYFDSTPPYDFSHSSITVLNQGTTTELLVGMSTGTYGFKVSAVDRGQPRYPGIALESVNNSTVTFVLVPVVHLPQTPFGVALTSAAATVSLRWMPVPRFSDFAPFAVSTAPTVDELSAYHVYRATSPTLGGWTELAILSTATLTWTDPAAGPQYYYHVRAENTSGLSARSVIRAAGDSSAYYVASDDQSFFEILPADVGPIEGVAGVPMSAYLIQSSSRPMDLGTLQGRVMKSIEFDAYLGGLTYAPTFASADPGVLRLRYELAASTGAVTPSAFTAGVAATPGNLSVYWNNGSRWVQLYGSVDTVSQLMTIQTKFFGQYQLRTVERTGGFTFSTAGISNRFLTPNGDGRNDNVVFNFDNPKDSAVTGKILDIRGRVVAPSLPPGPVSNSLMWDGTSGGRPVPGGVYIYQISSEGQTFTGTLVIVR